jgi:DNA repair exonuclease SbcCD ATPase subunit
MTAARDGKRKIEERSMEMEQASTTIQWLDEERRKDKQEMAALQERMTALAAENTDLNRKLQQLQSDVSASTALLQRLSKLDEILDNNRKEMSRQLEDLERRRLDAEREAERLRKVEREGINKSLVELRKSSEVALKIENELQARKEEEARISRIASELQKKTVDLSKYIEDRTRSVSVLEEGRRQDAKRLVDLQTEATELRKRLDESRGKVDLVEDLARRTDSRLGELLVSEADRRSSQMQWQDAQSLTQAERERAWAEVQVKIEQSLKAVEEHLHQIEQYGETHREVKKAAEEFRLAVELLERRITEVTELQRLAEERFRQDWAAFMADDQKRWTTHMLLRDEQWREHDRVNVKHLERLDVLEEQLAEVFVGLRQLRELDAARVQSLVKVVQEIAAEYEQTFVKVK